MQAGPPAGAVLTTVVSVDSIYLYFDSDEQTYLRYAGRARDSGGTNWRTARLPVYLGLANESGFPHEGRLDFVDNQVDPADRNDPDPRGLLQPRPGPDAGALRPRQAGGNRADERDAGPRRAPSAPTRTASSCWWLDLATRSPIGRSCPGG